MRHIFLKKPMLMVCKWNTMGETYKNLTIFVRFMATLTSCFIIDKAHRWGTFQNVG
jgi:hypothetical protein